MPLIVSQSLNLPISTPEPSEPGVKSTTTKRFTHYSLPIPVQEDNQQPDKILDYRLAQIRPRRVISRASGTSKSLATCPSEE
jgi:hypothetical protein